MKGVKQGSIPRWLLQGFSSYEQAKKFARQGKRGHLSKYYQTPGKSTMVWESARVGTYMKRETLQRKQQFVAACVAKRREDEACEAEKNARGQS
jgi:hypothetical protein